MKKPKFSVAASSTKKPKMTFSRFTITPQLPAGHCPRRDFGHLPAAPCRRS